MVYLLIFLLSGVGALLRYFAGVFLNFESFPWGTLIVNLVGSAALGAFLFYASQKQYIYSSRDLHLAVCVGLLGGLTTFSSFSLEVYKMLETHKYLLAGGYVLGSVGGSLLVVALSFVILQRTI